MLALDSFFCCPQSLKASFRWDYLLTVGDPEMGNDAKAKSFTIVSQLGLFCFQTLMKVNFQRAGNKKSF